MNLETVQRRFTPQTETRRKIEVRGEESERMKIVGYSAVFFREGHPETAYRMFDDLEERILPGAFDRALKEKQDVRGLFNHDPSKILGRTKAGTVKLSIDDIGLRYEIDVPDTTAGRDTVESLKRGDVDGSSFAFLPVSTRWLEEEDLLVREVVDLDLFDVGPVTYPAYEGSTSGVRAAGMDDLKKAAEEYRAAKKREADKVEVRLRMLDLKS